MDPLDSTTRDYNPAYAQVLEIVPNSTTILVLGILSIIFAGLIGLILGIIALNMAGKAKDLYESTPDRYTKGSISNASAGRVCAIIGVVISGLVFLFIVLIIANR
jgi:magnesium-transporting ATPase (P-type)